MIERYQRPEMKQLWSLENKFKKWLQVEIYSCEAFSELGEVPGEAVDKIKSNAYFDTQRVLELEKETRHDVIAFTRAVSETLGPEKKYVHYGLTSSDVVDTALSSLIRDALTLIEQELDRVLQILRDQARKYKDYPIIGRTHGVHAEPTTLGLKFALFYDELSRSRKRLDRAKENISVGKISGAVGTYANVSPYVEEYVCHKLGLQPALTSTQILQRDRHAELMSTLAILAGTMDKIATEIRNLQKTEVREVEEPFYKGQKGSSAMPHKRNPVNCEKISGLSRVIRSNAQAAFENQPLWHERDISHSSVERLIIPDSTTLSHYLLNLLAKVLENLHVYPDNMEQNLKTTNGLIYSQRVLLNLIDKGLSREKAYDLIQELAMKSWEGDENFQELLKQDSRVLEILDKEEIDNCFDPTYYTRNVDYIFERLGI
ncbi:adenylosuccinate lyase [Natranaerobius thermophilus]|uniref:Adenylosuccinate lyase n=1 Tax=Natranaerobius thermophilus (strain ATCC BAA-1301 / DSM 18059 / JW/NM-WN-LF) TaxID=457570 RepID=B2A5V8_NATTJ|nr:adenylosuccinate lyase [Natranaerobius thermophilus]ACB84051.1 Adenylosuccinate lyase [Natranaerobius thermophilus JW/NM-WN-LF]